MKAVVPALVLMGCIGSVHWSVAEMRATPQQIVDMAKQGDEWLSNVVSNHTRIVGVLIRPGLRDKEELLARFETDLMKTTQPLERGALWYLIGETRYWAAFDKARQSRRREPLLKCPEGVIPAFLTAFEAVSEPGKNGREAERLKRSVLDRLGILLAGRLHGANLSADLKKQVIMRLVDKLEHDAHGTTVWSPETRGAIYCNLGIAERLVAELPEIPTKDFDSLFGAMRLAAAAGRLDVAVGFAHALEKEHQKSLHPETMVEIFRVYRNAGDPAALNCAKALAQREPDANLELYDLSWSMEPKKTWEDRLCYIDSFIQGRNRREGASPRSYSIAASHCLTAEDCRGAMRLINQGLQLGERKGDRHYAELWWLKGMCHEKVHEKDEAALAYRRCMTLLVDVSGAGNLSSMCQRALNALDAAAAQEGQEE
jgi:hypothetical protein